MKDDRLSLDNQTELPTQMLYDTHIGRRGERERERDRLRKRMRVRRRELGLDMTRLVMLQWITGKAPKRNISFTPVWVVRNRPQLKNEFNIQAENMRSLNYHTITICITHVWKDPLHTLPTLCIHNAENNCLSAGTYINLCLQAGDHRWITADRCAARHTMVKWYVAQSLTLTVLYLKGEYMPGSQ